MNATRSDTDLLLLQAAAGSDQAMESLFNRHRSRLRRMIAVRMDPRLQMRVDPSDVVQETLLQANRKISKYLLEKPIAFYPWLRQMAWDQIVAMHRKHLYSERRSCRREEEVSVGLSDESVADLASKFVDKAQGPLNQLVRTEIGERVRQAIDKLPGIYREILVLRYLEQLSIVEAAEVLKIHNSAAKMRHVRAVERLRELLDQRGDESAS